MVKVSCLYYGDIMKYAWVEKGKVRDVCTKDPTKIFTPQVAAYYNLRCPDEVRSGWIYSGGKFTKPPRPMDYQVSGGEADLG